LIGTELAEFVGEQVQVSAKVIKGGSICVSGSSEILEVGDGGWGVMSAG
jgi:hypothetical protein